MGRFQWHMRGVHVCLPLNLGGAPFLWNYVTQRAQILHSDRLLQDATFDQRTTPIRDPIAKL